MTKRKPNKLGQSFLNSLNLVQICQRTSGDLRGLQTNIMEKRLSWVHQGLQKWCKTPPLSSSRQSRLQVQTAKGPQSQLAQRIPPPLYYRSWWWSLKYILLQSGPPLSIVFLTRTSGCCWTGWEEDGSNISSVSNLIGLSSSCCRNTLDGLNKGKLTYKMVNVPFFANKPWRSR